MDELIEAIKDENDELVFSIFTKNKNLVNIIDYFNNTTLHLAVHYNKDKKITEYILKNFNYSLNKKNILGENILFAAIDNIYNSCEPLKSIIKYIKNNKIKIDANNSSFRYLLKNRNDDMMEELINSNLDFNIQIEINELSPLIIACNWNYNKLISFLFKKNIYPNSIDSHNHNAYYYANNINTLHLLYTYNVDINHKDNNDKTFLMHSVIVKNEIFVSFCITHGSNINDQDDEGNTALHYAIVSMNKNIISLLIKAKANKRIKDNKGISPLELAKIANINL